MRLPWLDRDLPSSRIEIEAPSPNTPLVRFRHDTERPVGTLQYIVFAIEADIIFDRDTSLRVVVFLSRAGWKLARIRARESSTAPVPRWLTGLEDVCQQVVQAVRQRRLEPLLVGESERAILANDALYEALVQDLPGRDLQDELAGLLPNAGLSGVRADGLVLVTRDAKGEIWGFEYDIDREDGKMVLDSRPLVRASRFQGG